MRILASPHHLLRDSDLEPLESRSEATPPRVQVFLSPSTVILSALTQSHLREEDMEESNSRVYRPYPELNPAP